MTCLYGSIYTHTADIYTMSEVSNKRTGQKQKTWSLDRTVPCSARPTTSTGRAGASGENFTRMYEAYSYVRIKTAERVDLSSKITNIQSEGNVMWTEDDGEPTVFEVTGITPVMDVFSTLIGYEVLCNRSSDQRINP